MKKIYLSSQTIKTHGGYIYGLYTNHYIVAPPIKRNSKRVNRKIIKQMKESGIMMGEKCAVHAYPYILYTSRCDEFIARDEFKGAISLGNNVVLYSNTNHPLPNSTVRLNIVKVSPTQIGRIEIGDNTILAGTSIISYDHVKIGNNVLFGPMVTIVDADGHALSGRQEPDEFRRIKMAPVEIADGAWIGFGAFILKGVKIGKNSVVGANAVVHKSVPDNSVVAGNPAKEIKSFSPDESQGI